MKLSSLFRQEDRSLIEKYCRESTRSAYLGDHTALCRVLGELLMYVDTRDLSLTPHMLMNGYWEMWVSQAIASHVKPGMRCIDVGANCGYFTLLLSELVGPTGLVCAYEPQQRLADLIQRSLTVNGFGKQGMLDRSAVGDYRGKAVLNTLPTMMGSASLLGLSEPGVAQESVEITTLDEAGWAEEKTVPVDFVKIDIQGLEMKALAGMRKVIAKSPKIAIAMEFTPTDHDDPEAELLKLQEWGLVIGEIGTDGLIRPITIKAAADLNGGFRMLWLTRVPS
jgi:FkbM family methyltransferase